jgi:phosphonate transport system substrate-binding protein
MNRITLIGLFLCLVVGCAPTEQPIDVDELKISILPFLEQAELEKKFQPMVDYLEINLGVPVRLVYITEYNDMVTALGRGDIDLVYFGPVTYVEAKEQYPEIQILVGGVIEGSPTYHSYVVAEKDSAIEKIEDIEGKKFGFGSSHSTSSHLIPRLMLSEAGIPVEKLASYEYLKKHDIVAANVINGTVDAGGIIDQVYEKNKDKLKAVQKSNPIPPFPFTVREGFSERDTDKLVEAFLRLDKSNPEFSEILGNMDKSYDGFVKVEDEDYDVVRDAMTATYGSLEVRDET